AGISVDIIARWLRLPPTNLDHGTALRVAQEARDEAMARQLSEERSRQLISRDDTTAGIQSLVDLLGVGGQEQGTTPQPSGSSGLPFQRRDAVAAPADRKSTRLNSSHVKTSYAVFCLKKKKK